MIEFSVHRVTEITGVKVRHYDSSGNFDKNGGGYITIYAHNSSIDGESFGDVIDVTFYSPNVRELLGQLAGSVLCQMEPANKKIIDDEV